VEICPLVSPRNSQPSAQESLVLHERGGVIDSTWLRQQLGLDGKAAARTTAERTNMT
jgi:aspartyl aminopeptidase